MLERYFVRPTTVDRIRAAWLGEPIERYVTWLHENGYAARNVGVRVPLLVKFGEFAQDHGATSFEQLPAYVDDFVADWVRHHSQWCRSDADRRTVVNAARGPVEQLLQRMFPGYSARTHPSLPEPASTLEAEVRKGIKSGGNVEAAAIVGARIAEKAKAAGIDTVAFDRSGFRYHGRVKALADAAREAGLKF